MVPRRRPGPRLEATAPVVWAPAFAGERLRPLPFLGYNARMVALADPAEVRLHLVAAARAGVPLTYAELLERLGYRFSRPKMRALCAILGAVDEEAEARGEPELAVLVVRQSDGIPGQGWWVERARRAPGTTADCRGQSAPAQRGARARGYEGPWEGPEAKSFISAVQAQTFDWWQSRNGTAGEDGAD